MDDAPLIPPLRGCLCCHQEGTLTLVEGRKILGFGSDYPVLKCEHCGAIALLDAASDAPDQWRIRYRRVNPSPEYYYPSLHFGNAGWLSASDALAISTNAFVQRQRIQQVASHDLSWLKPAPLSPPPPLMSPEEIVYLKLKGVTLQEMPSPGLFGRSGQGAVLDSGKFYVTNQKLHLLGQRRDWSHPLHAIQHIDYDHKAWVIVLNPVDEPYQYHGLNSTDQLDAQLIASIVESLW